MMNESDLVKVGDNDSEVVTYDAQREHPDDIAAGD
jgi:hypothetical protein